jgi:hypothetical protein
MAQYIPLGASAYGASDFGFPPVVLENWFAEEAGDRNDRPYRLVPAPGLTAFKTGLQGAVRGMVQADGLLSGKAVIAAGTEVYSLTSAGTSALIGTITGTDECFFAASQADLVMTAGGSAYVVTASLSSAISIPVASGGIVHVAEMAQIHLYLEDGTGRIHFSDVAAPTTVTKFFTAETEPDNVLAIRSVGGLVHVLGTRSAEMWEFTGSTALPFRLVNGASYPVGIVARGAVTSTDFSLFAVGRDQDGNEIVYRITGGQPQRISTHPIERLIEDVTEANRASIRMSSHGWGGHSFIGLHLPGVGDYFFDVSNGTWHRRRENNATRYLVEHFFSAWGERFAGDVTAGSVYRLDRNVYTHNSAEVRRVATAIIPIEDGRPPIDNLTVEMQAGIGLVSGQGSDPQVMMRYAKDGRTFSNELSRSFGKIGEYAHRAVFGSLGRFHPPAVVIEIAVSDPVPATVTGLTINRSRV